METLKVLGQSAPLATTDTDLYTVPASTVTVGSTLVICNRSANPATFRIAIRVSGASISNEQYIAYDAPIAANTIVPFTIGITLSSTDVVTVQASSADLSFNLFGSEVTS